MFETGIRQLRMAMAIVWGWRIDPSNVERLIADGLRTLETFGAPGDDVDQLLDGPFADPDTRRTFQDRALRRTAERLARRSPYYARLFDERGVRPSAVNSETMAVLPLTTKSDLIRDRRAFVAGDPHLATRTTGTTGRPAEVWLSRYELELWPALSALSGLLRGEIAPSDCMQINISSRATAAVHLNTAVCRLVGARSRVLGVVPPDESLDCLADGRDDAPTLLGTYPSYLAQLVAAARRRGLGPDDFRLRRIDCGGEVLSAALNRAAEATFGAHVNDTFGMTEILPVSGRTCGEAHLHHDVNMGFVEVIDPETGLPAEPGSLGTVVVTPYYPYRECMPVFRYDTRDVVRRLPEEGLSCEFAGIPATSRILGKADHILRPDPGTSVTVRDLVEVLEGLPSEPWPARFRAAVAGGRVEVTVPDTTLAGLSTADLEARFSAAGIDATVTPCPLNGHSAELRRLRADLLETTFSLTRS